MEGTNHLLRQRQLEDLSLDDPSMDNNSTDSPSVDDPSFLDDLSEKASSPFQIEVSSAFHPLFTKATALTASAVYFLV